MAINQRRVLKLLFVSLKGVLIEAFLYSYNMHFSSQGCHQTGGAAIFPGNYDQHHPWLL